jgi:predicted lipid-binding transport protein (Tim44 family)
MKHVLLSTLIALCGLGLVAEGVEAKRLGGGSSSGFQRQTPPAQPAQPVPAKPAPAPGANAPGAAAAPAAAAPAKRSWMGPIAGLAAGLGLAALMSHLGLGAGMANFLMILLMVVAGFFLVRFLMRRFGPARGPVLATPQGMQFAGAGPAMGAPAGFGSSATAGPLAAEPAAPGVAQAAAGEPPAGFDTVGFVRIAKLIFIRMQAANDAGNLDDLRQFSTPEMFAVFRLELQDRKGAVQRTDVVQLDAQMVDYAEERDQYIVSVRFHGLIREEGDGPPVPFDEIWHLVKPTDGSREWAIAGIAQHGAAS